MNNEPIFTEDEDKCDHYFGICFDYIELDGYQVLRKSEYEKLIKSRIDWDPFNYCPDCGEKL